MSDLVPDRRLGRRPPHTDKPALRLSSFLTGAVPAHPRVVDHLADVHDFELYDNDRYGDCGPVSVANSRKLVTRYLTGTESSPTLDQVLDLYRRSGNPGFPADDNGVVMQDMLEELVKGGIAGIHALGFAKVDHHRLAELDAAVAIFGFLLYGVNLEVAQQQQRTRWTYSPSSEWGGHAVLGGGYGPRGRIVVTWADQVAMTSSFVRHQLEEAWVVIWPEHLTHPPFLAGVDVAHFAADYTAITGRPFPGPVPASTEGTAPTGELFLNAGGLLQTGTNVVHNDTGRPERLQP